MTTILVKPGEKIDWDHPYVLESYDKILKLSEKTGIPTLAVPWPTVNIQTGKAVIDQGSKILLYSIDQQMFYNECLSVIKGLKNK